MLVSDSMPLTEKEEEEAYFLKIVIHPMMESSNRAQPWVFVNQTNLVVVVLQLQVHEVYLHDPCR